MDHNGIRVDPDKVVAVLNILLQFLYPRSDVSLECCLGIVVLFLNFEIV